MKKITVKDVFLIILSIILSVVVVGTIIYCACNWQVIDKMLKGTTLYDYEQVQSAYDDGFFDGNNANNEQQKMISDLRALVEKYESNILKTNAKLKELGYTATGVADYVKIITELTNQISTLNEEVERYRQLLDEQLTANQYVVRFYDGEELIDLKVVDKGSTLSNIPTRESTDYREFLGFADETGVIDLTNYVVDSDKTFRAVYQQYYKVEYLNGNTVVSTQKVKANEISQKPADPVKSQYDFVGWQIDGETINPDTYTITKNVRLIAAFMEIDYYIKCYTNGVFNQSISVRYDSFYAPEGPYDVLKEYYPGKVYYPTLDLYDGDGKLLIDYRDLDMKISSQSNVPRNHEIHFTTQGNILTVTINNRVSKSCIMDLSIGFSGKILIKLYNDYCFGGWDREIDDGLIL